MSDVVELADRLTRQAEMADGDGLPELARCFRRYAALAAGGTVDLDGLIAELKGERANSEGTEARRRAATVFSWVGYWLSGSPK